LGLAAPATTTAGQSFTFALAVPAGYLKTVTFTSADGGATLPGRYTFTAQDGCQHTFTATLTTAGPQTLTAVDAATQTVLGSASLTVSPAAADHLEFAQQPASATAGQVLPPVTVRVEDRFGNLATDGSPDVTVALLNNPSGGTLKGTTSRMAQGGFATFDDLSITGAGSGCTLQATAVGLIPTLPFASASGGSRLCIERLTCKGTAPAARNRGGLQGNAGG
jgi:hypothetical protein